MNKEQSIEELRQQVKTQIEEEIIKKERMRLNYETLSKRKKAWFRLLTILSIDFIYSMSTSIFIRLNLRNLQADTVDYILFLHALSIVVFFYMLMYGWGAIAKTKIGLILFRVCTMSYLTIRIIGWSISMLFFYTDYK